MYPVPTFPQPYVSPGVLTYSGALCFSVLRVHKRFMGIHLLILISRVPHPLKPCTPLEGIPARRFPIYPSLTSALATAAATAKRTWRTRTFLGVEKCLQNHSYSRKRVQHVVLTHRGLCGLVSRPTSKSFAKQKSIYRNCTQENSGRYAEYETVPYHLDTTRLTRKVANLSRSRHRPKHSVNWHSAHIIKISTPR